MRPDYRLNESVLVCQLNDGTKMQYDFCSDDTLEAAKEFYSKSGEYIGTGVIYSVNGVEQNWDKQYHFFVKK